MDIGKAFRYPTHDKDWFVKLLIGTILTMIPIVQLVTYGYMLRVVVFVSKGIDDKMPEWDDWGGDFIRGLVAMLGALVYMVPIFVITACFVLPIAAAGGADESGALVTLMVLCLTIIIMGYSILSFPMTVAAVAEFAQTGQFGAFLNFGARFREVMGNIGLTLMLIVWWMVASFIVSFLASLTIWLCGVGLIFVWWGNIVYAHLVAQYGLAIDQAGLKRKKQTFA